MNIRKWNSSNTTKIESKWKKIKFFFLLSFLPCFSCSKWTLSRHYFFLSFLVNLWICILSVDFPTLNDFVSMFVCSVFLLLIFPSCYSFSFTRSPCGRSPLFYKNIFLCITLSRQRGRKMKIKFIKKKHSSVKFFSGVFFFIIIFIFISMFYFFFAFVLVHFFVRFDLKMPMERNGAPLVCFYKRDSTRFKWQWQR